MRVNFIAIFLSLVCFFVAACDQNWPTRKNDYVTHYYIHRFDIEKLEAEFLRSNYSNVQRVVPQWADPDQVFLQSIEKDSESNFRLEGKSAIKWDRLLSGAGVNWIGGDQKRTSFRIDGRTGVGSHYSAYYVHSAERSQTINECRQEFAEIRCGECGIDLDDGWWIHYHWSDFLTETQISDYLSNELPNDDYVAALANCQAQGRRMLNVAP